jgi:AcrR family transcriptional regulator
VGRWEPDARVRLVGAAVDLCAEQGYDATTVAQIAARAGLTKATFFRYFPDKREVLFAGQATHSALLAEGVAAAPAAATPLEAVARALDALTATFTPEQREFGPRLLAVIAANGDLQERDAFKRAGLAAAMATALRGRGVPDPTASLAADLGVEAFHRAFSRWIEEPEEVAFPDVARETLEELRRALTTLD